METFYKQQNNMIKFQVKFLFEIDVCPTEADEAAMVEDDDVDQSFHFIFLPPECQVSKTKKIN
jgi:hypothetical protein